MNKYKCFNSKCDNSIYCVNTIPRVTPMICNKCSCVMIEEETNEYLGKKQQ